MFGNLSEAFAQLGNMDQAFNSPITQFGLGILAANQPGASFGQAVGQGGLTAVQNMQRMGALKEQSEYRKLQAEQLKAEMEKAKQEAILQAQLAQKAEELGYGDLYRFGGGKAVADAMTPDEQKLPEKYRLWQLAGSPGTFDEWYKSTNRAPVTNVNMGFEREYDKQRGKGFADLQNKTIEQSDQAATSQYKVDAMRGLLDMWKQSGGQPGALAEIETRAKALAKSFGVDLPSLSEVGPAQALASMGNQLVLANIGGEGGMPANNFSDADRKFVTTTVPQLTDDEDAFLIKLEVQSRMNKRAMEKEDFMAANDRLPPLEARKAWRKYVQANPLFDDLRDWKNPYKSQDGLQIDQRSLEAELRRRGL